MVDADFLKPLVLPVDLIEPERRGRADFYLPAETTPRPAIVFVHGGPVPAEATPTPRDWPVFRGYGSLAARRGCVGVTVDHRLHDPGAYPAAAEDVAAAVRAAREDPRVDADRVAVWVFSGGGLLLADWLRERPAWLRCVAASYPILGAPPGRTLEARFRPAEAIDGTVPVVLTRVGRERPLIAATVEAFIVAAEAVKTPLTVVDVPHGHHGFDTVDDTGESRAAVEEAFAAVLAHLN
jgi:dipeptidyl aminopeptidase/acylaminoacyl peptidase